jgi:rRNA biogenesis protein RRP5
VDADVTVALRSFREGDKVKAMICSIDQAKRRISFGLKPSYFTSNGAADAQADADESEGEEETQAFGVVDDPDGDSHAEGHVPADDESDSPLVDHNEEGDYMRPYVETQRPSSPPVGIPDANSNAPVQLMKLGGFRWTGGFVSDEDEKIDSSGDENDDRDQKGTDKKRKRKEIDQDLTATMHSRAPESSADFDRLLLGSPNSSYLWVQYMSFQLQLAEVEKAREIGRRALETIHFREDREKLNVWIALLNLENRYGMEESLETTFKDAARHNDSKAIHLSLANIFDQTEKYDVCSLSRDIDHF